MHLLPPDKKFVPYIVESFDANKHNNVYLVVSTNDRSSLPFSDHVKFWNPSCKVSLKQFVADNFRFDAVISYSFDIYRSQFVTQLPDDVPVGWMLFGHEYYTQFPSLRRKQFLKQTSQIVWKLSGLRRKAVILTDSSNFFSSILFSTINVIKELLKKPLHQSAFQLKAMQRVQLIGFPATEEASMVCNQLGLRARFQPFCCIYVKPTEISYKSREPNERPNILLGNSSTPTNNHVEIIDALATKQNLFNKLCLPLSYGSPAYRSIVLNIGKKKLGDKLEPWIDFVSPQEYQQNVSKCQIAIMNHRRQQGLGTTLLLLASGVKVFLRRESNLHAYLRRLGVTFGTIETEFYGTDKNDIFEPLTITQMQTNKRIIEQEFDKQVIHKQSQVFANKLLGTVLSISRQETT